jgi:mRNA-degrading endonuclease RelE of RelBE toxin-antitoxin system
MSINENPIEIRLTPRFQKDLKILAKRYRSIRQDLQPLLQIYSSNCRTKKNRRANRRMLSKNSKTRNHLPAQTRGDRRT